MPSLLLLLIIQCLKGKKIPKPILLANYGKYWIGLEMFALFFLIDLCSCVLDTGRRCSKNEDVVALQRQLNKHTRWFHTLRRVRIELMRWSVCVHLTRLKILMCPCSIHSTSAWIMQNDIVFASPDIGVAEADMSSGEKKTVSTSSVCEQCAARSPFVFRCRCVSASDVTVWLSLSFH